MMTRSVPSSRCHSALYTALLYAALLGASLLFVSQARADSQWVNVSETEGLPGNNIQCLYPTASGGMLIGTSRGLAFWDGERVTSYTPGNGLVAGGITAAIEWNGSVWVGSWGEGVGRQVNGRWIAYRGDSLGSMEWIADMAVVGGSLWIATYGHGLVQLTKGPLSASFDGHTYRRNSNGLASDWLTCLLPDRDGGIWVGTERAGLCHLDKAGRWTRHALPEANGTHVTALAHHGHGDIWIGTRNGIIVLDAETGCFLPVNELALPTPYVSALSPEDDGAVWVGTDGGLVRWQDGHTRTITRREGLSHDAVTSLAIDAQGRTWVGSSTRGLTVRGRLDLPVIERLPVILVHGWRGPDSDRLEDSEFRHLARWLREDGFDAHYARDIRPSQSLHANAQQLGQVVDDVLAETGASAVYIIAFSMGGLNTRAYLESTRYHGQVQRAFILGTPHRGEYLWKDFLLWESLFWTQEPSAIELLPEHARLFNETHSNYCGVPYTLVAGDARSTDLPTLFRELPPSDGLVSTYSALGPPDMAADRHITEDIHAWGKETILLGLPTLLLPRTTYDAHIRPYLFDMMPLEETSSRPRAYKGSLLPNSLTSEPVSDYALPQSAPRTAMRHGSIRPGETITLPSIPIDTEGRTRFHVRWQDVPLDMVLHDPTGRTIDEDVAIDDDSFEFLELDFADYISYIVTDTMPGDWPITLMARDTAAKSGHYVAYASFDSSLELVVSSDQTWYDPGETVNLSARIEGATTPVAVERVHIQTYAPSRTCKELDIVGNETQVNDPKDREWHGQLALGRESGYHMLFVTLSGTHAGHHFERQVSHVVGVRATHARLTRVVRLIENTPASNGVSGATHGTRRVLAGLEIGVDIKRAGEYLLAVSLLAGQQSPTRIAHPVTLDVGRQRIVVAVPNKLLENASNQGSVKLASIMLADISGPMIPIDEIHNLQIARKGDVRPTRGR